MNLPRALGFLFPALLLWASGQNLIAGSGDAPQRDFDDTSRFIFYSVLEGLYEDGVSSEDVNQILMRKPGQSDYHFIYACPICTATIWALETYRQRPLRFYGMKSPASTFGPGLPEKIRRQLYSADSNQRLVAINTLMRKWLNRRMDEMNLSPTARADLMQKLEVKRKKGMECLQAFRRGKPGAALSVEKLAPAYLDLDECAVCNGAVGKLMKLPDESPAPAKQ